MLPPEAQIIAERLAFEDQEVIAAAKLHASRRQELNSQKRDALAERARLVAANKAGILFKEKHGHDEKGNNTTDRKPDTARLKAADAAVDAIQRKEALLGNASPVPRLTAERLKLELAKYPASKLVAVERPSLPLAKNERPADALPRFREAALELRAERRAIEKAPLTLTEAERAAHAEIDRVADRGLPKTLRLFQGGEIGWPRYDLPVSHHKVPDGLAFVAFVFRDEVKRKVSALLKVNESAFPDAMSAEEKAERLAELSEEIDVAERLEAACVEQVVAEGGKAYHRPDASVLAVLSLRVGE
jgi:hypothetical protein